MQVTHDNSILLSESAFLCGNNEGMYIYCSDGDSVFKLNSTGKAIIESLGGNKTPKKISDILKCIHDSYTDVVEADVISFIEKLMSKGIIQSC